MDPRDFCNWFQGVVEFADEGDSGVAFSKVQADKIKINLATALKTAADRDNAAPPSDGHLHGRPPNVRC